MIWWFVSVSSCWLWCDDDCDDEQWWFVSLRLVSIDHEEFWNFNWSDSTCKLKVRQTFVSEIEAIILGSRLFRFFLLTFSGRVAPPNSLRIPFTNPTQKWSSFASFDPQEPGGTGYDSTNIYPGHWGVYPWRKSHGILISKGGSIPSALKAYGPHDWSYFIRMRMRWQSIPPYQPYPWLLLVIG